MAVVAKGNAPAIFDLKSATMTLVALVLQSTDLVALADELTKRFGDAQDFFNQDPVVIDLVAVAHAPAEIDFEALVLLLRSYRMHPVAVRGGSSAQMEAAQAAGLADAHEACAVQPRLGASAETVAQEAPPEVMPTAQAVAPGTMVIHKPLRSGQRVYAQGGDLIVLAAVNFGAEAIADGHVHVYAPLRGKAIAGASGNTEARIFSTCMEPELVAIAGNYRTTENPLPVDVVGKPAQIRLDGERLVFEPIS